MKFSIILSVVALAARAVQAMPPACLLHAVNTQDNPADLSSMCGSNALKVQSAIANLCSGSNVQIAQSAFISTCSGAGVKVASYTATATSSASGTSRTGMYVYTTAVYNSSCSCTQTIVTSAAGDATVAATRTGTSTGTVSTGGAAYPVQRKVGGYAAAAVALVGAVAAL